MDSRQGMSMMGPPGYPHMPPMNTTGPTMTGSTEKVAQLCSTYYLFQFKFLILGSLLPSCFLWFKHFNQFVYNYIHTFKRAVYHPSPLLFFTGVQQINLGII